MTDKLICSGRKYVKFGRCGEWKPCQNTAKVEREGLHYCGIHDPVAIKQKDDAKREQWNADWAARTAAHDFRSAAIALCNDVSTEILQSLGRGWLAKHLAEKP